MWTSVRTDDLLSATRRPSGVRAGEHSHLGTRSPITAGHRASPGSTDITHLRRRCADRSLKAAREFAITTTEETKDQGRYDVTRVRVRSGPPMRNAGQSGLIYRYVISMRAVSILVWMLDVRVGINTNYWLVSGETVFEWH